MKNLNSDKQNQTLFNVQNLRMWFPANNSFLKKRSTKWIKAVNDVSFEIRKGETLGLVGESGSGKTTIGRSLLHLNKPTGGSIFYKKENICNLKNKLKFLRKEMQIIFQDPFSSLNPRMTIESIIGDPIKIHFPLMKKNDIYDKISKLLLTVGLDPIMMNRYPYQFSGGQRQRIGIARALALEPAFIVCDESVSALDVSIQAQIINLLSELQIKNGITYLFIAHDLAVVRQISSRIAVMYLGKIVELAPAEEIYSNPIHPYTKALLAAVPIPDPEVEIITKRIILSGEIPDPSNHPNGCIFHPRCPYAINDCKIYIPVMTEKSREHYVSCLRF